MKSKFILTITLACSSAALMCSEQTVNSFFKTAAQGNYQELLKLAKTARFTEQEIITPRDSNGNSLIGATIQGYILASKELGAAPATQLLFDILAYLLPRISKKEAIKLLNLPNKSRITPLFMAAQLGLLKVVVLLHQTGALSALGTKKASALTNNAQLKTILIQWENLEGDWQELPTEKK